METAILLIASVVVSSVFVFMALSTGLLTSDRAYEMVNSSLSKTRGVLELKGPIIARVSGTTGTTAVVTSVEFEVFSAAGGSIDLTPGNVVLKYSDKDQTVLLNSSSEFTVTNVAIVGDADNLLETGEVFRVTILDMATRLSPALGVNKEFTIEIIPPGGVVLFIERRTPLSLEAGNDLN